MPILSRVQAERAEGIAYGDQHNLGRTAYFASCGPEIAEAINIVRSLPADRIAARDALLDLLIRAQTPNCTDSS